MSATLPGPIGAPLPLVRSGSRVRDNHTSGVIFALDFA